MTLDTDQLMETLVERIVALRPTLERRQRKFALELYHLLAQGAPVRREHLAVALGWPTRDVVEMLERWPSLIQYDNDRAVVGSGGLGLLPTKHKFEVEGHSLYTWCAWDSLFIPEILGRTARVESSCPESGDIVTITISPEGGGAATADPPEAVVSFTLPEVAEMRADVRASFCDLVFFFRSLDTATAWTGRHDGTFILTLEQAIEVGKQKNTAQFGNMLARGSASAELLP